MEGFSWLGLAAAYLKCLITEKQYDTIGIRWLPVCQCVSSKATKPILTLRGDYSACESLLVRRQTHSLWFLLLSQTLSSTHAGKGDRGSPQPLVHDRSPTMMDKRQWGFRGWVSQALWEAEERSEEFSCPPGANRGSVKLLTLELWPIYWLTLQNWISQDHNQAEFVWISNTHKEGGW